jgi:hypothetical protein
MTSKIVVNNIEADAGVSTVTFGGNITVSAIGIGTDKPISGRGTTGKILNVTGTGANSILSVQSVDGVNDRNAILELLSSGNGGSAAEIVFGNTDLTPGTNSPLVFSSYYSGSTTERARISNTGNLGIGTNNPECALDVFSTPTDEPYANIRTTSSINGGFLAQGTAQAHLRFATGGQWNDAGAKKWQIRVGAGSGIDDFRVYSWTKTDDVMRINNSGQLLIPYQPVFQAYGVSGGTFASGNYWIFPSTFANVGSHYNTSNGIFTAPVSGTYFFTWSNIGGNGGTVYRFWIRRNNANVGSDWHLRLDTSATGNEYSDNGHRNLIISASANDTFRIYYESDNGTNAYPGANDSTNNYPTFGGYLIG